MTAETRAHPVAVGSILFTDLVGFTAYNDAVGDGAALALLETQTGLVDAAASQWGGRILKEIGDGLMIWFGSAAEGLRGALAVRSAIDGARSGSEFPLAIRMGLHHGEALRRGADLVGQAVNIASRVSELAGPGELLVTEQAIRAAGSACGDLALDPVGPTIVKGVRAPVWLHRLR
jgi:class 3 adenylate cyclase